MKRRNFLKRLGIGAAAVVAAPKIIEAAQEEQVLSAVLKEEKLPPVDDFKLLHPLTPEESFSRPMKVITASEVKSYGKVDGLYLLDLEGHIYHGDTLYVPACYTNKNTPVSAMILAPRGAKGYEIAVFDTNDKILDIPIGQELVIGASAYIEPI